MGIFTVKVDKLWPVSGRPLAAASRVRLLVENSVSSVCTVTNKRFPMFTFCGLFGKYIDTGGKW